MILSLHHFSQIKFYFALFPSYRFYSILLSTFKQTFFFFWAAHLNRLKCHANVLNSGLSHTPPVNSSQLLLKFIVIFFFTIRFSSTNEKTLQYINIYTLKNVRSITNCERLQGLHFSVFQQKYIKIEHDLLASLIWNIILLDNWHWKWKVLQLTISYPFKYDSQIRLK